MINRLWAALILIAAAAAAFQCFTTGPASINALSEALFKSAQNGVDASLGLIAALVLWLGIFEIAQQAGIVQKMARLIAPVLGRLMPDVPRDHPAHASATMNIAMSMLGLDNGALPSGLKTMQELETLNPTPGTASRAQQMFLVYMTASVTIFPVSILGYRMQAGAAHPADVFLPLLLAGYIGLFTGLVYMSLVQKIKLLDPVLIIGSALFVTALCGLAWVFGSMASKDIAPAVALLGNAALVLSVVGIVAWALHRGVPVYDAFLTGGSKGFALAIELIPYIVGMLVAIGLLRASGAFGLLQQFLAWGAASLGMDNRWAYEVPHGLMKMFSGGGARAMMLESFKLNGPDSFQGHLSSIVQGAHDTTFYVLAACAGAAKLKNLGSAVGGALVVAGTSFVSAVVLAYAFFG
jgi:spore maturation protein SpmA/spore maturation protein SpmB